MLESIDEEYEILEGILSTREELEFLPDEHERELIKELILLLRPFKTATDQLEASAVPTLHLVIPWYHV